MLLHMPLFVNMLMLNAPSFAPHRSHFSDSYFGLSIDVKSYTQTESENAYILLLTLCIRRATISVALSKKSAQKQKAKQ